MSGKGEKGEGVPKSGRGEQILTAIIILVMLASGLVLVFCFGLLQVLEMGAKTALLSLVVASCVLASFLLTLDDSDESRKAFPFLGSGLIAFFAAFIPFWDTGLEMLGFALLAVIPLLIALVGLIMTKVKQAWVPLSFIALGLAAYVVSIIVATGPLGSKLVGSIGLTPAVIITGTVGILGPAIACGVYIRLLGNLLGIRPRRP